MYDVGVLTSDTFKNINGVAGVDLDDASLAESNRGVNNASAANKSPGLSEREGAGNRRRREATTDGGRATVFPSGSGAIVLLGAPKLVRDL